MKTEVNDRIHIQIPVTREALPSSSKTCLTADKPERLFMGRKSGNINV